MPRSDDEGQLWKNLGLLPPQPISNRPTQDDPTGDWVFLAGIIFIIAALVCTHLMMYFLGVQHGRETHTPAAYETPV